MAEKLAEKTNSEEHFRTAINRAYYAAYVLGTLKLTGSKEMYEAGSETDSYHEQLQIAFSKRKKHNISAKLSELFEKRVIADYYPDSKVEHSSADNGVQLGRNLVKLIEDAP